MHNTVTALIVDDETPMRTHLRKHLQQAWPELLIVGEAANGIAALEMAQELKPDVVFLDIRMPGKNGLEAASQLVASTQVVFVTAYNEFAIQAFEKGALDYLLKPLEPERLLHTCQRIQQRVQEKAKAVNSQSAVQVEALLKQLMQTQPREYLRWVQASVGTTLRMINTREILFFKADTKYTLVQTEQAEYLIRKSLKELEDELDPREFWRIYRSTLVRVAAIAEVTRDFRGRQLVGFKDHPEKLEVSRNHAHLFQQM